VEIEQVYICGSEHDLRYTRCCVASIRRWYPEIPITLLKDETNGQYSTQELELAWNVDVFESERPLPGRGWAKLDPLFLAGRRRCLILDSDIVFLGYRQFPETMDEIWESFDSTPTRLTDIDDDRVLVVYRFRARSRGSGAPIDQQLAWIMTIRDGKLSRTEAYSSVHEALEAAGLPQ
jgi:hypothetical protein